MPNWNASERRSNRVYCTIFSRGIDDLKETYNNVDGLGCESKQPGYDKYEGCINFNKAIAVWR